MGTKDRELVEELLRGAASARRAFPRGGFDGFEPNAVQLMLALLLEPDQSVNQLGESLELHQATVSHTVAQLGEELVRSRAGDADRRQRQLRLTPRGRRTAQRLAAEVIERVRHQA